MISPGENKRIGKHVRRLRNQSQSISNDQYTGRAEREIGREGERERERERDVSVDKTK